jgi:hypothetical protein
MITCKCGKTIDKVPTWMQGIQVDFVCNNCPNRQTKNIAFLAMEPALPNTARPTDDEEIEETEEELD